ncbi:hypothetical protein DEO72_LG4g549 [Vigna unguiculata]|uniref:Uncharacterized protein n=1 Tax=Vigna unguiculata TaxID=3917 RepID=A0A4D6LM76_VIGUN|nr:hypothetical protein DEO72_LG4g549 [Vigna unguiculata]
MSRETNSASSPKRELQNLVSVLGSCCSLRRPVLELSDRDSRLGESGSPKRGRDGNLYHFSSNPHPGEARWASLSEIEVLAWANRHGLSENGAESCFCALFGLFACYFVKDRNYMLVFVVFGLEGLSPIGVWDVLDGWTHDGHGIG